MLWDIWTFHFIIKQNEISTTLMLRKSYHGDISYYEY